MKAQSLSGTESEARNFSLRGQAPRRFGDGAGNSGSAGILPTADQSAAMKPGALRGSAQSRDLDRLAHTLFVRIYPVIGLVLLLTQFAIAFINYQNTTELRKGQAAGLARVAVAAIAKPGWETDPSAAHILRAVLSDPSVRRAVLRDGSGRVVAEAGEDIPARAFGLLAVSADMPAERAGRPGGELTLTVSGENLGAFAQEQALLAMGAILVLMVAFVLVLHLNVRRHVLEPLQRLLAAMGQVEKKNWTRIEPKGDAFRPSNEIDSVCLAFNRMVVGLESGDQARQLLARLEEAHARLEAANHLVMESIGYARRIQSSTLPAPDALDRSGLDVAVLWEPLNIVGGDYYWMEELDDVSIMVVADCTGHGVPGAFITLIVAMALDHILHHDKLRSPAAILAALDGVVRTRLRQDGRGADSDDGLDCGICVWNRNAREVVFCGAGLSLVHVRGGVVTRERGDRRGIGFARRDRMAPVLSEVTVAAEPDRTFFLMTDGVVDQMGTAPTGQRRLLGPKALGDLLVRHAGEPLSDQLSSLRAELADYRGQETSRDDMTVIAFRPQAMPGENG